MTTTFADYPVTGIAQHPRNVRRAAVADDELVASVTASGILEPVVLGPEVDGIRHLIAGNRRFDAATKAGLDTVPAVLRDDLDTEADQVAAMLQENLHRADLTAIEEADAYEQLQLFGADAAAIARTTGVSKATVKGRLRLATLPDTAKESVHTGEATLAEAITLLDLHPDDQTEALQHLGTADFSWRARQLSDARARAEESAANIAEWTKAGIPETESAAASRIDYMWPHELRDADLHEGCLAWQRTNYSGALLVCTDSDKHRVAPQDPRQETPEEAAAREAEWEAREKAAAEKDAARAVRIDALRRVLTDVIPTKGRAQKTLEAVVLAALPSLLVSRHALSAISAPVAEVALDTAGLGWQEQQAAVTERGEALLDASWPEVVDTLTRVLAALIEDALSPPYGTARDYTGPATAAWGWLTDTGYLLSTADQQARATATGQEDQA